MPRRLTALLPRLAGQIFSRLAAAILARLAIAGFSLLLAGPTLAAEEGKGGMPQLIPADWAPQLIWLVITFGLLYFLMSRVALPRIAEVLESRDGRIAGDLDEAERLKKESEQAIAKYEAAQAEARAKALSIGSGARELNASKAAAERSAAEARLAEQGKQAEAAINTAKQAALANVKGIAAGVAQDAVKKLLGEEISADAAAAAVAAAEREGR